jgi:hypothetical protein
MDNNRIILVQITARSSPVVGNTSDANARTGIRAQIEGNSVTTNPVAGMDCSLSTADLAIHRGARAQRNDERLDFSDHDKSHAPQPAREYCLLNLEENRDQLHHKKEPEP